MMFLNPNIENCKFEKIYIVQSKYRYQIAHSQASLKSKAVSKIPKAVKFVKGEATYK